MNLIHLFLLPNYQFSVLSELIHSVSKTILGI
mgnify:CR=1